MKSYSDDLMRRVIALRSKGHTGAEVAVLFSLSKRTVERYWRSYRDTGSVSAKRRGGYRRSRIEGHDSTLKGRITKEADLTLEQLKERIREQLDISLGTTALWHRLERLGLSYKKNLNATEQERSDIKEARAWWKRAQIHWDVRRFVFLDEKGTQYQDEPTVWAFCPWRALQDFRPSWPLAEFHLHCSLASRWYHRTHAFGWPHGWERLRGACKAGALS